jgi:hypothetical protein
MPISINLLLHQSLALTGQLLPQEEAPKALAIMAAPTPLGTEEETIIANIMLTILQLEALHINSNNNSKILHTLLRVPTADPM